MEYRDFEIRDTALLTEYYLKYLNGGSVIEESVKTACESPGYFGSKAVENNDIAAFFTLQEGIAFTYPHTELEEELLRLTGDTKTATVDTLIVLPEYRRQGIAKKLAERNTGLLRKRQVKYMLAESWIYPDGRAPSLNIYQGMGKTVFIREIADFYKDSHEYGISCPLCGRYCKCGAAVVLIEIKENERSSKGIGEEQGKLKQEDNHRTRHTYAFNGGSDNTYKRQELKEYIL